MSSKEHVDAVFRASAKLFLAASLVVVAVTLVGLEMGQLDWLACYRDNRRTPLPLAELIIPALYGLAAKPMKTGLMAATALPGLLAIALSRNPLIHLLAFLTLLVPLYLFLSAGGHMHACDRKGCIACFGVAAVVIMFQLPASGLLCFIAGVERLLGWIDRWIARRRAIK